MSFAPQRSRLSGLPLQALPGVVFDTETTGLDAARDRVIAIGAVRLQAGSAAADAYSSLVDPGRPIPQDSTTVHGITDADVAGARPFAEVMSEFAEWAGSGVVVGFAVGFDLAVLKAEHERAGLVWRAPRWLDVRHLLQLVKPTLPNPSLDTAAAWLGLAVSERHRAVGDARLTAEIFRALLPKLHDAGITTLAQAERACRSLTAQIEEELRAGWHSSASEISEYARVDSFAYRHRVADLMSAPPLFIDADAPFSQALRRMVETKSRSLFLAPAKPGGSYGIVTERDVLRALDGDGAAALERSIGGFAKRPLIVIDRDEFAYRAMTLMSAKGFRHLGVVDGRGVLVGALSARDLLRQRADEAVSLGDSIETAATAGELGRVWTDLTSVANALVVEKIEAREIAAIVSCELRALTRRACQLAEAEMMQRGQGGPPAAYAMMVLGSGGRGESLLAMDQDNAIVFADGGDDAAADRWLAALGERVSDMLAQAGVAYCKGGVMASNSAWRGSLTQWRQTVGHWITRSRPEDILNLDIFFDARPVHGDEALADGLRRDAIAAAQQSRQFLKLLALSAADFQPPTGWFGRLRLDAGRIDLKAGGLMPIFSTARVLALQHRLDVRSTRERLDVLRPLALVADRVIDDLIQAQSVFLELILRQQLRDIDDGLPLTNKVAPGQLSGIEKQELKWAIDRVPSVNDLLGTPSGF